ncbi:hypothetical protein HanRHA438_Chr08g0370131 [Helianthus annuus]|nr:hypothetical protein HanIR_Chr08g0386521 [Helianthus annuus]KAJ0899575.1 hypothetical protein HanRHA438_Chr08g0370131 [Helianthus annuus]
MGSLKILTYRFYYFFLKTLGSVNPDPHHVSPPLLVTYIRKFKKKKVTYIRKH